MARSLDLKIFHIHVCLDPVLYEVISSPVSIEVHESAMLHISSPQRVKTASCPCESNTVIALLAFGPFLVLIIDAGFN